MCLAIPLKIIEVGSDGMAKGVYNKAIVEFSIELLDNPNVGDYAIVHAGTAIELLNADEAVETISLIERALKDGES